LATFGELKSTTTVRGVLDFSKNRCRHERRIATPPANGRRFQPKIQETCSSNLNRFAKVADIELRDHIGRYLPRIIFRALASDISALLW